MTEFFEFIPAIWLSSLTVYQRLETTPTALTVRWKESLNFSSFISILIAFQWTSSLLILFHQPFCILHSSVNNLLYSLWVSFITVTCIGLLHVVLIMLLCLFR